MLRIGLRFAVAAALCMTAADALADGEGSYVFCDNGLRCVAAPCPSSSALDLATGEVIEGVSIDTSRLPPKDEATIGLSEKIYAGRIVLRGSIEEQSVRLGELTYKLPFLVATGIVRVSKDSERKHCSMRSRSAIISR